MKQKKQNIPPIVRGLGWVELSLAIDTMVQCVQMTNTLFSTWSSKKEKEKSLKKVSPRAANFQFPLVRLRDA